MELPERARAWAEVEKALRVAEQIARGNIAPQPADVQEAIEARGRLTALRLHFEDVPS